MNSDKKEYGNSMKTIKSYKKKILRKYQESGSEYLSELSPAKIRHACLLKFENGLDKEDLNTFARFFDFSEKATYLESIKKIENVDIDKFRPFKNFLKKKTKDTLNKNAELIAVLVDFKPRPYNNYRKEKAENINSTESSLRKRKTTDNLFYNRLSSALPNRDRLYVQNGSENNFEDERRIKFKHRINFGKPAFIALSFFALVFFIERYIVLKEDLKKATMINNVLAVDNLYKEGPYNYSNDLSRNAQVIPLVENKMIDSENINSKEVYIHYFQHEGILYFGIVNR